MNAFKKMIVSMRGTMSADAGFEAYYGTLMRNLPVGGPSAAEARRDFQTVRETLNRVTIF